MIRGFLSSGGSGHLAWGYGLIALLLWPLISYGLLVHGVPVYADCHARQACQAADYAFFAVIGFGFAAFWPLTLASGVVGYGLYFFTR
jgi:hypothetical protein